MSDQTCPECGKELPSELGQHSVTPLTGRATCPHCGADVHVAKVEGGSGAPVSDAGGEPREGAGGPGKPAEEEIFSGQETVGEVMEEVKEKNEEA